MIGIVDMTKHQEGQICACVFFMCIEMYFMIYTLDQWLVIIHIQSGHLRALTVLTRI